MSYRKQALLWALALTGVTAAVRQSPWRRRRLLILCYHGVSIADEHDSSPELYVTQAHLRRRLEHLRRRRCNILPLGEALQRLRDGTLPTRAVALTFDDGTRDFAERATPVLREFEVPATVYPSTYYSGRGQPIFDTALRHLVWYCRHLAGEIAFDLDAGGRRVVRMDSGDARVGAWHALHEGAASMDANAKNALLRHVAERAGVDYDAFVASGMFQVMSPEEMAALPHDLIDVQLHTHRHRVPREVTLFTREFVDNRAHLARAGIEHSRVHFCYPNGEYWDGYLPWLRMLGVASATTCVPGLASAQSEPLLLPRFIDTNMTPDVTFDAWVSGVADMLPRRRVYRFATAPRPSGHRLGLAPQEVHQHELA